MQRRLELACALVHDPALLFLDEPTAGIDPLLRASVWEELHRLRATGRTMLVTTQYINEAESCDLVALIAGGRLLALATPDDLRREASGGDVIGIETAALFDGGLLEDLPFVRGVRQTGPRHLTVIVDDAGPATPDVVDAIQARGGEVASAREERLSFDEVFTALVERDQAARDRAAADADAAPADRQPEPESEPEPEPEPGSGGPRVMRALTTTVLRLLALVGKELVEVVRRPGALLSLVLGPFLIMAVFGLGYNGVHRALETVVVVPPEAGLPTDVKTYQDLAGGGLHIAAVVDDASQAEAGLQDGSIDVVVVAPADAEAQFKAGKRSVIEVVVNTVDPLRADYAGFLASNVSNAVNQTIIRKAVEESEGYATAASGGSAAVIPPEVVAAPTEARVTNVAPSEPRVLSYFGPAVLALILQHLAVTLVALSLVRERTSGVIELFRVAPVNAWEVMAGKVLAYLLIGAGIAAITVWLLVGVFQVPMLGDPAALAVTIGLVLLASLGIGLVIAVVSDSERQAVQLSLLLLLASVFFSGFVLAISEFSEPVRALAFTLPVTHGIRLMQDIMLRGGTTQTWEYAALGLIALVTFAASWLGLRRNMAKA